MKKLNGIHIAALCGSMVSSASAYVMYDGGGGPTILPAIVVVGYSPVFLGFPVYYPAMGLRQGGGGFAGGFVGVPRPTYGFMAIIPPRLVGPRVPLGPATIIVVSRAKIDTDGDPNMRGWDTKWQPGTSTGVDAALYPFVVRNGNTAAAGVGLRDWALVTDNINGVSIWARVMDNGPANGSGEISEAAAAQLGMPFNIYGYTIGNPTVTIRFWAHSAGK